MATIKMTKEDHDLYRTTARHPDNVETLNALADRIMEQNLPWYREVYRGDAPEPDPFDVEADWRECHGEA